MTGACCASCAAKGAMVSGLGGLSDWFLPSIVAKDVGEWIAGQNRQASGTVAGGISGGIASAASAIGPWVFASALVLGAAGVAVAIARGGGR